MTAVERRQRVGVMRTEQEDAQERAELLLLPSALPPARGHTTTSARPYSASAVTRLRVSDESMGSKVTSAGRAARPAHCCPRGRLQPARCAARRHRPSRLHGRTPLRPHCRARQPRLSLRPSVLLQLSLASSLLAVASVVCARRRPGLLPLVRAERGRPLPRPDEEHQQQLQLSGGGAGRPLIRCSQSAEHQQAARLHAAQPQDRAAARHAAARRHSGSSLRLLLLLPPSALRLECSGRLHQPGSVLAPVTLSASRPVSVRVLPASLPVLRRVRARVRQRAGGALRLRQGGRG